MRIIPRSEWRAALAKYVNAMPDSRLGWIVHYNGPSLPEHLSGAQAMQSIQRYHQNTKNWSDIAYSFGISQEGEIFEGRGWYVQGGHTSGTFPGTSLSNNKHAHAVIFLMGQGQVPTQAALDAFAWLVSNGATIEVPKRTTPHKVAAPALSTSCPGPELTAITKSGYFLDTHTEPGIALKELVRQLYLDLLGREPDEAGHAYWADLLDSKSTTVDFIRWEFVKTRFAALAAADAALIAKIDSAVVGGPTAAVLSKQAFDRFLDDLAEFAKTYEA